MSMFNWQAKNGDAVVSNRLWIYIVVTVVLTILVIIIWIWWFRWTQKKYEQRMANDLESEGDPGSK